MEWPKRARTADWENGVLALEREKQFEVPKLTAEIMERLAGYTLVGFHVKGYPVTDELLAPFAGHKSGQLRRGERRPHRRLFPLFFRHAQAALSAADRECRDRRKRLVRPAKL